MNRVSLSGPLNLDHQMYLTLRRAAVCLAIRISINSSRPTLRGAAPSGCVTRDAGESHEYPVLSITPQFSPSPF